jgi:toxin ParE1/3/4
MRTKFTILPAAVAEFQDAAAYCERQAPELGERFRQEYVNTLDRIAKFPKVHPRNGEFTRQCKFRRFPYAIVYRVDPGEIVVAAVAHLKSDQRYWRGRLS